MTDENTTRPERCAVCGVGNFWGGDWICERCRTSAVVAGAPETEPLPAAVEATNPSEVERALFLRRLSFWEQFCVTTAIECGAAGVRDALEEFREFEERCRARAE